MTTRAESTAIHLSNVANVLLLSAMVFASVKSGSLAITAVSLDLLLDLLAGFILWITSYSMKTPNRYKYPIGKRHLQPLGMLVFAAVVATLGLQIVLQSVRCLISKEYQFRLTKQQERWIVVTMSTAALVKFVMFFYCSSFSSELIKGYAQKHLFVLTASVLGLAASIIANYTKSWIDSVGAIVLATYTIYIWSATALDKFNSLVGQTAAPEYLQKLTHICWNHHKSIRQIDTVKAYAFGAYYFVEVDIVLPSDLPLKDAHDIGEALQEKLEQLPEIERAFVHLDYEFNHRPEHGKI